MRLDPGHVRTHGSMGVTLGRMGGHVDALACFERAADLDPEDPFAHGGMGTAPDSPGRRQEADLAWEVAIVLDPPAASRVADRAVSNAEGPS